MRNHLSLRAVALATATFLICLGYSGGPSTNSTFATGSPRPSGGTEYTCALCHSGGSFGEPQISVTWDDGTTDGPLTEYVPGSIYTVTVQVSSPTPAPAYGFQGVIINPNTLESIGEAVEIAAGPDVRVSGVEDSQGEFDPRDVRDYVEQIAPSPTGTFQFQWTAPRAGSGPAQFFLSGNAVDGFGSDGDSPSSAPTVITLAEGAALPIELVDFDGRVDKNLVELTWSAKHADGFSHFEVERSSGVDDASFVRIGSVPGDGEPDRPEHFAFTDRAPLGGPTTYRLRMVDLDGSSTLSPLVALYLTAAPALPVYPNPASSMINVPPSLHQDHTLTVRDLAGRVLLKVIGSNSIDVGGLPPGVYLLERRGIRGAQFAKFTKR